MILERFNSVIITTTAGLYQLFYSLKKLAALTFAHRLNQRKSIYAFNKYGKDLNKQSRQNKKYNFNNSGNNQGPPLLSWLEGEICDLKNSPCYSYGLYSFSHGTQVCYIEQP
jgi:hypothetical protein